MALKKELKEFKALLKEGIGTRTQKEFAGLCGITPQHINRMLKNEFIPVPNKKTLELLAGHMKGVTYAQLLESCGYEDEAAVLTKSDADLTERQLRMKMPIVQRIECSTNDIIKGASFFCNSSLKIYPGVEDICDTAIMIYCCEKTSFILEKVTEDAGKTIQHVLARTEMENVIHDIYFAIPYYRTANGVIPLEPIFAGEELSDIGRLSDEAYTRAKEFGIDVRDMEKVEFVYRKRTPAEEMILRNIFGEGRKRHYCEKGIGFYYDFNRNNFLKFIKDHEGPFWEFFASDKNDISDEPMTHEEIAEAFSKCGTDEEMKKTCLELGYCSFGEFIADIMSYETDYDFTFAEATDEEKKVFPDKKDMIICVTKDVVESIEKYGRDYKARIQEAVVPYARELYVSYVEDLYNEYLLPDGENERIEIS